MVANPAEALAALDGERRAGGPGSRPSSGAAAEPLFRYDLPIEEDPIRLALDRRVPWIIHGETFSQQSLGTGPWPDQGWKLHVSATPLSAADVLEAALDVLLADGARFKVVKSITRLGTLNQGLFGISQIGKFITVYPSDDTHAVRLAVELDAVTRGFRGPRVPTDRVLRPGSLVHYRYGAMIRRSDSETTGYQEAVYDLLDPAGRLTNDFRLDFYQPPHPDIADPFEAAGVRVPPPGRGRFLNGRYFVSDALAQTLRGGVFRAVDVRTEPPRMCLLKESWHDVGLDSFGRDSRDWAANEEHILSRYGDGEVLPHFYDSFEVDGDRYIVIEYVEGTSFDKVLSEELELQDGIDPPDVIAIGLDTADALARLHELGLVFRDFKPGNLIRTPRGRYRLIDFGIVYEYLEGGGEPLSIGTPPFCSREQYAGDDPCPADDVFSWGAVLYHLAGGAPSFPEMPKGDDDLQQRVPRRPLAEVRPSFPPELAAVIDRAVAWERADRYPTMRDARDALEQVARRLHRGRWAGAVVHDGQPEADDEVPAEVGPEEALALAQEIGDALCEAAEEHDGGLCWERRHEWGDQTAYSPDLYAGAAGIGLFLAELARQTGDERYADAARGAGRWLAGPAWGRGRAQHGLHCGEAGIAYFFLRLAELLDAPGYVTAADLRGRRLRGASPLTVDLLYGTAGTILGLLALHAVTGDAQYLSDACAAGDHLVATALSPRGEDAGRYWEVSAATPGGSVINYLGLLHGAAGIGLALAQLGSVTGEERFLDTAVGAAELLLAQARPGVDGDALSWALHLRDKKEGLHAHCHGAGGIAQFFLALDRVAPDTRYREAARAGFRTVAGQRAGQARSGLCHGLSGTGDTLLDAYQAFGDPEWLSMARECGGRLQRFRVPERPGVYAIREREPVSPDLFLGYAGIGSFLLRLAHPANATDLILGPLNNSLMKGAHHVRRDAAAVSGAREQR